MSRPEVRPRRSPLQRAALVLALAVAAVGVVLAVVNPVRGGGPNYGGIESTAPAAGVDGAPTTVDAGVDQDGSGIVPKPNSGRAPRDAGDRGGALQSLTFFLICAALLAMAGLIWRESTRKLRRSPARPAVSVDGAGRTVERAERR